MHLWVRSPFDLPYFQSQWQYWIDCETEEDEEDEDKSQKRRLREKAERERTVQELSGRITWLGSSDCDGGYEHMRCGAWGYYFGDVEQRLQPADQHHPAR